MNATMKKMMKNMEDKVRELDARSNNFRQAAHRHMDAAAKADQEASELREAIAQLIGVFEPKTEDKVV